LRTVRTFLDLSEKFVNQNTIFKSFRPNSPRKFYQLLAATVNNFLTLRTLRGQTLILRLFARSNSGLLQQSSQPTSFAYSSQSGSNFTSSSQLPLIILYAKNPSRSIFFSFFFLRLSLAQILDSSSNLASQPALLIAPSRAQILPAPRSYR